LEAVNLSYNPITTLGDNLLGSKLSTLNISNTQIVDITNYRNLFFNNSTRILAENTPLNKESQELIDMLNQH